MTESLYQSDIHPLVREVESIACSPLSDDERAARLALPKQVERLEAYQDIVREGDRPSRCFAVLAGFTSAYKFTTAGKRQVMAYHLSGDVTDLQSLHLKVLDNSISATGACRIGFVQHNAMRAMLRKHPGQMDIYWRLALIDAALLT